VLVPYIWSIGIMVFSTGLFVGGVAGEPRRTNLGLSYTNPDSPLFQADWSFARVYGAIGGSIMFAAMLLYFVVFFATLLRRKTSQSTLELPVSEPYHDEDVRAVQSLRPWIVAAVILLFVAYTVPFFELARARYEGAPPYTPGSPVAQSR
jgi:cytochrome c oxidase subunit 1